MIKVRHQCAEELFVSFNFISVQLRGDSLFCAFLKSCRGTKQRKRKKKTFFFFFFALKHSIMFTYELLTVSGSPCSAEHAVVSRGWGRWVEEWGRVYNSKVTA